VDSSSVAPTPAANCNAAPTAFVANSALPSNTVTQLAPPTTFGYTTNNNGAVASVAGDLSVKNVVADIIVGDV
jgi:hypothetical protein